MMAEKEDFKYYAFISYSHKDKPTAKKLQKRLERYHLPSKVIESHPDLPKKLSPIFVDESDLVAKDGSLSDSLKGYLNESNYLIVICSPNSAKSPYVNDEVDYFINTLGRADHIIPFIVDGLPHSKDPALECFTPALLELPRELEPLGIDLRTFGWRESFIRVTATLLRLNIDYFKSREAEERKRRLMIFTPIAAALAVIIGGLIWYSVDTFILMESNNAVAQYNFGLMYYTKQDYVKAKEWYEKAAAQGYADAQTALGSMYQNGIGVEQNYAKAVELYEKAVAQGSASAQNNLGYLYNEGLGVKRDYDKAKDLYEKAAAQSLAAAQYNLGFMYQNGTGVEQDYTKARELYEKAAAQGDASAQNQISGMYYYGYGVKQDYAKAKEWLEKALAQGEAVAQYNLGFMYQNGIGVEQDYTKARELYEKAAAQGYASAQSKLGLIYVLGLGVKQDSKAKDWYEKAAVQGDTDAQYNLGNMYINAHGVKRDYEKAREWYEKAAAKGFANAQYNLGVIYEKGLSVKQDYAMAKELYEKAAAQGDKKAQERLNNLKNLQTK